MLRTPLAFALLCLPGIATFSLVAKEPPTAQPVYITTVGNTMQVGGDFISVYNFQQWLATNAPRLGRKTPIIFSESSRRFLSSRFDLVRQAQESFDHVYLVLWDEKDRDQPPLVLTPTRDDITPILDDMRARQKSRPGAKFPEAGALLKKPQESALRAAIFGS